jgi:hypothetical protein
MQVHVAVPWSVACVSLSAVSLDSTVTGSFLQHAFVLWNVRTQLTKRNFECVCDIRFSLPCMLPRDFLQWDSSSAACCL